MDVVRTAVGLALTGALASAAPSAMGGVGFQDGAFAPGSWSATLFNSADAPAPITIDTFPLGADGPGDPALRAYHANTPDSWTVAVHLRQGAVYDPSAQGAIDRFLFSIAHQSMFTLGGAENENLGQAFGLAIVQGSQVFLQTPIEQRTDGDWTTIFDENVRAEDFGLLEVTSGSVVTAFQPDLSASGAPISLGFYSGALGHPLGRIEYALYDNWAVSVVQALPAPGAFGALAIGAGALTRRRR